MAVYSEEIEELSVGSGVYTAELPNRIPDGYCSEARNFIATGETLEGRQGFTKLSFEKYSNPYTPALGTKFVIADTNSYDYPAIAWGTGGLSINVIRGNSKFTGAAVPATDGYATFTTGMTATGIAFYRDRLYYCGSTGIYRLSAFNWSADTATDTLVSATPNNLQGMILFKDRLFAWDTSNLFYTDVAAYGGYPDTWAASTQNVSFTGITGKVNIQQVLAYGSKLIVFTDSGIFSLHVEGDPGSWIKRTLDSTAVCTSETCAFETGGLIYYVTTRGVWVSDGYTTTKLSGVIENVFYEQGQILRHRLHFMDEGMVLSICPYTKNATTGTQYAGIGRVFYSKISTVAWTEWVFDHTVTADSSSRGISEIVSIAPNVFTLLSNDPITFVTLTTKEVGVEDRVAIQLLKYDGYQDEFRYIDGAGYLTQNNDIDMVLVTKVTDGAAPIKTKQVKNVYLEMYTSAALSCSFTAYVFRGSTAQATVGPDTFTSLASTSLVQESNLPVVDMYQLQAFAKYRAIYFKLVIAHTNASEATVKVGKFYIVKHTERNEVEQVR